jgi:CDP-paratose 2-epimerase
MRLLVTGICGFVGSTLARALRQANPLIQIWGMDNLIRAGSELNRRALLSEGIRFIHGDIRNTSDLASLPAVDWVLDAAANPSVLAGVDGVTNSRQLVEHNLFGTVNLLEYCRTNRAGFMLLSTSRVYSIATLSSLPMRVDGRGYCLDDIALPQGVSTKGVAEECSTQPPVSLYGSTKLASECLALEYGATFDLPVWINRCGVLAGAGQFGKADQGIFSYWLHAHHARKPLKFIGFSGLGYQVRDCLHPRDLVPLLLKQMNQTTPGCRRIQNLGGGGPNSMSLAQLHDWCDHRFGPHPVERDLNARRFDVPWMIMDSSLAREQWGWEPRTSLAEILEEIARHAERHPSWIDHCGL